MKFNEHEDKVISVPKYKKVFVYFLLYKKEVVYVGQTTNGIYRPFSHTDIEFDEVKIIYCEENFLDIIEDSYIGKYEPKYNKQRNYNVCWSLMRVRNNIRKIFGIEDFTIPKLRKVLSILNINTKKDIYTKKEFIKFTEYKKVIDNFTEVWNVCS